jgi:hypothetical protein
MRARFQEVSRGTFGWGIASRSGSPSGLTRGRDSTSNETAPCYDLEVVPFESGSLPAAVCASRRAPNLEWWDCSSDFLIDTEPLGRADERWGGILNLPNEFSILDNPDAPI